MIDNRNLESGMPKGRYVEVDIAKGLLAILVVLGHAIQQYEASLGGGWGFVRVVIYSFHMAAFVFAAGFCSGKTLSFTAGADILCYLRGRAFRLLLPYVAWGVIYSVLRLFVGDSARIPYDWNKAAFFFLGYNPDGAMWFLWTLFAATMLVAPLARALSRWWVVALLWVMAAGCMMLPCELGAPNGVRAIPIFVFFLVLGLLVRANWPVARSFARGWIFVAASSAVFACSCLARYFGWHVQFPWYALSALAGTMLTMSLGCAIAGSSRALSSALSFLGRYAMAVYVLGEPVKVACRMVFARMGLPVHFAFPAMLMVTLVMPVALALLLRRSRMLSALLLGEGGLRQSKL